MIKDSKIESLRRDERMVQGDNLIAKYLQYTENHEAPVQFHLWPLISIIGGALARQVYLDWGHKDVFPNHYIVLAAESAESRKSSAADIAVDIFTEWTDRELFPGKITLEALYQDLAHLEPVEKGSNIQQSRPLLIFADELGVFLSPFAQKTGLPLDLSSLYTCPKEHIYRTKHGGTDVLKNACINILACTTPAWIERNITPDTFEEGFIGRCIFIYAEGPKRRISLHHITADEAILRREIGEWIKKITEIRGKMHLSDEALRLYDEWYQTREAPPRESVEHLSGFWGREHWHILKLCMIFSIASDNFPEITDGHFEAAKRTIRDVKESMHFVLDTGGIESEVKATYFVLDVLKKNRLPMSRMQLGRATSRKMGTQGLSEALQNLLEYRKIEEFRGKDDGLILYAAI